MNGSYPYRLAVISSLYLVSDIGYSFFFGALGTILLGRGVSLGTVGMINLLGIVYFSRFLIAPIVDRYGSASYGHYRGWLMCTQVALILTLLALTTVDPVADLGATLMIMTVVLVLSAFHDTAISGLSIRILAPAEHGVANGLQTAAASLSMIIGTGGAVLLYASVGWVPMLCCLAAVFVIPLAVLARFDEPTAQIAASSRVAWRALVTYLRRPKTALWSLVVLPLYLLGDWVASAPQTAMLMGVGWTTERVGFIQYTVAIVWQILAALAAGAIIARYGRRGPAVAMGVLSTLAVAATIPLAAGQDHGWLTTPALIAMAVIYGAKLTWTSTVSMDLVRNSSAATDFTVPMSMTGMGRAIVVPIGMWAAECFGFVAVTVASVVFAALGTVVAAVAARGYPNHAPVRQDESKGRAGTHSGGPIAP
ncbi:MFS transporter [Nocardia panacis]|uniref:MFS transporter n=1 Tax=Nocardia panacis TaxID=2340916 RepID=A0A3A4K9K6_9NOCA|nr:MFS transporter [Nocardia panacis]RJO70074.1 MFS transporter [Nocardia panacis]